MNHMHNKISSQPNFVEAGLAPAIDKTHFHNKSNDQKQGRPPRKSKIPFAVRDFQQESPLQSASLSSAQHSGESRLFFHLTLSKCLLSSLEVATKRNNQMLTQFTQIIGSKRCR